MPHPADVDRRSHAKGIECPHQAKENEPLAPPASEAEPINIVRIRLRRHKTTIDKQSFRGHGSGQLDPASKS